ncbi:MAG: Gfo/Idh/MocA family oxidoreductase [Chthoniobacteraceae bacterium]
MSTPKELRLAMLGMIEGNGHPYSWSAIVNGYDPAEMAKCPYAGIPKYLGAQPLETVRIPGARVTHIWTDDPADAPKVARASKIEHVVARPEDVIGHVDAVIIATDDGDDHIRRARPFIEAGLPVFVDKPMATNVADLDQFLRWHLDGKTILSTSGMRYAPEMREVAAQREQLGELRWLTGFTCKTWERYGIHTLEAVSPITGAGFVSAQTNHQTGSDIVHLTHHSSVQVTLAAIHDAFGSFGSVHVYGTKGQMPLRLTDTYTAFREQLVAFIEVLRTGRRPFPFSHTVELMAIIIAGIRSRAEGGRIVKLREIYDKLHGPALVHIEGEAQNLEKARAETSEPNTSG